MNRDQFSRDETLSQHDSASKLPIVSVRVSHADIASGRAHFSLSEVCDAAERAGKSVLMIYLDGDASLLPTSAATPDEPDSVHTINQWERLVRRIERTTACTIAVASSSWHGLGLSLLLACDYRCAYPDLQLGLRSPSGMLLPGMDLYRLVQQIGVASSRRMVLFGATIEAARALELQLVDSVSIDAAGLAEAHARSLDEASVTDLALRRQLLLEAASTGYDQALGGHLAACDRTLRRRPPASKAVAGVELRHA